MKIIIMTTLLKALINKTAPVPMATVMYQPEAQGNKNMNNYTKLNFLKQKLKIHKVKSWQQ